MSRRSRSRGRLITPEELDAAAQAELVATLARVQESRQPNGFRQWLPAEVYPLFGAVAGKSAPCPVCGGNVAFSNPAPFVDEIRCDRCDNSYSVFTR